MSTAKRTATEGISQDPGDGDMAKKARLAQKPSRVIHIRNLPEGCTAAEVSALIDILNLLPFLIKYGQPTNTLIMSNKQALVEMPTVESANMIILREPTMNIRGQQIYLQFSEHQELGRLQGRDVNPPSKCLIAKVTNLVYGISLQTLYSLFTRAGRVDKIVCFMKQSFLQALVQMDSEETAANARRMLNNQDIYAGCCHLAVEFSKLPEVTVRPDSDMNRARDFLRSPLTPGETLPNTPINQQMNQMNSMGASSAMGGVNGMGTMGAMGGVSNIGNMGAMSNMGAMGAMGNMSNMNTMSGMSSIPGMAGMAPAMSTMQGQMGQMGQLGQMGQTQPAALGVGMQITPSMQLAQGMTGATGTSAAPGAVILVSNLNPNTIQPEHLFILCGVYGDVVRVKIMHKNRSRALVQFQLPQHAATAIAHLNGLAFQGTQIRLTPSKFPEVALPRNEEEALLTKDYSKSKIHRFKSQESYKHIHPPSSVLHLSRLPSEANQMYVTQLFVTHGFQPKKVHMFPNDKNMAFVELNSTQEAAEALVALHNKSFGDNLYLRAAFSRHAQLT